MQILTKTRLIKIDGINLAEAQQLMNTLGESKFVIDGGKCFMCGNSDLEVIEDGLYCHKCDIITDF